MKSKNTRTKAQTSSLMVLAMLLLAGCAGDTPTTSTTRSTDSQPLATDDPAATITEACQVHLEVLNEALFSVNNFPTAVQQRIGAIRDALDAIDAERLDDALTERVANSAVAVQEISAKLSDATLQATPCIVDLVEEGPLACSELGAQIVQLSEDHNAALEAGLRYEELAVVAIQRWGTPAIQSFDVDEFRDSMQSRADAATVLRRSAQTLRTDLTACGSPSG